MKIGVCGTGRMGSAIAQRLMSVGHEVAVWNRNSVKTKPLVDAGAKLDAFADLPIRGQVEVIVRTDVIVGVVAARPAADAIEERVGGVGIEINAAQMTPVEGEIDIPRRRPRDAELVAPLGIGRAADRAEQSGAFVRAYGTWLGHGLGGEGVEVGADEIEVE